MARNVRFSRHAAMPAGNSTAVPPPPPRRKAANLLQAVRRWARAGFPLAPRAVRQVRRAVCQACPRWHPAGNLGLGECRHPACGCTRAKWWLATSRCPETPARWVT